VVTGASTGIGRASALHLDSLGFDVHAGIRKEADAEALREAGSARLSPLMIDVTKGDSIAAAAASVGEAAPGGLAGLVNNAGIPLAGPLEFVPLEDMRRQFDVNLFGLVAVTQALLPLLRRARGRIVNISSIGGRVATPFLGPYVASKFALEGLSDSLRAELRPWGIEVSLVEPGSVATEIWEKGQREADSMREKLSPEGHDLYGRQLDAFQRVADQTAARGISPHEVAKQVEHALTARRPKTRYLVGRDAKVRAVISTALPDRAVDRITERVLGM
jgi:NAD(P)-dependent dehydrogenase (short-subunit alcohol dehydrogenase family)